MLRQLNHTIIALVPKSEHSPSVADYRPISCCNVIYKVITKIIADRLSPALEQLIDSSQAAFVGGRNITDNIFSKSSGTSLALPSTLQNRTSSRAFLWNSKRAPVAWEDICHPKEEGGLGIRHIQSWNVALLARVLWNIHCKADTLWAKWVNEVYLRGASLWDWQPKKGDSLLLRRLAGIRDRIITDFGSTHAANRHMTEWTDNKGLVTSKAYEYFRPKLPRQPWKASIWKAFIPPKYSFILWLGLRERMATRDRLAFLHEDPSCSMCINSKESAKHLFFECSFSSYVWSYIRQWFGITRRMSTLLSAVKWLKKGKTGSSVQNKARHLALACMVYSLWRHRNEIIFEGKASNPDGLVISIKITVYRLILTLFPHGL
ncbi:UNVERIFIED_CONTAM: hypothetical protein Scaly_2678100 [Sesamum calycinum]|uniref:Reverse transcriptase zinc-binding domain-containing protein n=1 Tax=Sesamum calycinum TaxID=2727403 RepID=A0AAW2J845_9LAMI